MQIPIRLAAAFRPRRSMGMLLALAFSTIVMVGTPFLIPDIADRYDVSLTAAGLLGVFQLSGFAVGSWLSGRRLTPNRQALIGALLLAIAANGLSATLPPFVLLLTSRLASGLSLGTITWFAWTNAFAHSGSMNRVALVGPIIGVAATPAVALIVGRYGAGGFFLVVALLPLLPLLFTRTVPLGAKREQGERRPAVPTARVLLIALTAFSLGGSAVYTFGVTIAERELGLSAGAAAIGYTANAVVSIPGAGWRWQRGIPSPWMALTGLAALLVATSLNSALFYCAVTAWGFFYWMGIPGVFDVLANVSAYPEERAGDAQAMMALGRVGGPLLGGLLLDGPGNLALGLVGAGLMWAAAAAVFTVRTAAIGR